MNILDVKHLTKRYAEHTALSDVSLSVPKNSIFGLLGPNGAGKTTLIRIITQIIAPDNGEVYISGKPLEPAHIRTIGYLPEERGLYKKMKVGDQLLYLARLKGLEKKDAVTRIKHWLDKLDMRAWANKNIEDLSKGMQQKIQFIATVVHEPKLIILDEPFSGFDPVNASLIRDEILELREKGASIIFSTHRMESVEELCDHIALINKSKKILDGPKRTIKENHRTNTYIVDHRGEFTLDADGFEVVAKGETEQGYQETTVRILNGSGPNELLNRLISQTEINGFREKIPSINEIFIQEVSA
ncbi:ABC transporter ATP-binding protein [Roseivirga sp. BDSF3-8]|uniref:ABC transporter ATP-binding protein n=1 Tax=Roseivirga sp. BDSF3-8 TaxID=3241598 RepID=UPI00353181B6